MQLNTTLYHIHTIQYTKLHIHQTYTTHTQTYTAHTLEIHYTYTTHTPDIHYTYI